MNTDVKSYIQDKKNLLEKELKRLTRKKKGSSSKLYESIRYSILGDGKRLRPVLCLASCETFDKDFKKALPVACAIEMIHTYSLVHDDLPSMDNDDLRRGIPTNHNIFGEAIAILAGDALLTDAFNVLVIQGKKYGLSSDLILKVLKQVSDSAGSKGMVLGQSLDLHLEGKKGVSLKELQSMHSLKTGKMIEASVVAGGIVGGASDVDLKHLEIYSRSLGLAYQIIDDILDSEGGSKFGKTKNSDKKRNKSTYTSILGLKKSKQMVRDLTFKSIKSLDQIDRDTTLLKNIATYLGQRNY